MGVAAKAADQRVVLQLLVQAAAQPQHSTVHYRANTAHPFHITGALHLAQRVTDHGTAHPQFGGKVYLGGQAVGLGIAFMDGSSVSGRQRRPELHTNGPRGFLHSPFSLIIA